MVTMTQNNQMLVNEKQIPDGYKTTEIGLIPHDWSVQKFGELFEQSITRMKLKRDDLIAFVGMQDVSESAQLVDQKIVRFDEVKTGFTFFGKGDVLVAKITPCFENGKGCITDNLITNVGFGSTEFHVLRANQNSVSKFIYYWTVNSTFRKKLELDMVGSAGHRRVPLSSIQNYLIPLPATQVEQEKIATVLSDTDALISELEKLIDKKQSIKTATMQQLLTGKTRLPEFALREDGTPKGYKDSELGQIPEDWEVVCLGDIGQALIGLTYSPNDTAEFGTLVLRSSNVQNGKLSFDNNVFVRMALPDRVIVKEGDILICVRNGSRQLIGKCALIDKKTEGSAFGAFMSVYRTKSYGFIFYQFQSNIIQNQINETMGATINQITNKDLNSFRIMQPLIAKEKNEIYETIKDLDKDINLDIKRLNKLIYIKQGMMQELLTGKTRLA